MIEFLFGSYIYHLILVIFKGLLGLVVVEILTVIRSDIIFDILDIEYIFSKWKDNTVGIN